MAIAIDASTPVRASATAALTTTTASFTAPSSAVLVACVSSNTTPAGNPTLTVSDSGGLTWGAAKVLRQQSEGGGSTGGTTAIFGAVTASSTSRTVTATASVAGTANGISVKVYVVTGADTANPYGATAEGASQVNNTTTTGYNSTVNNSRGFACGTEWNELGVPTSTDTGDGADVTGAIAALSCFKAADTATSGTSVTFNLDAAGAGTPDWTWVALEILPAAGDPAAIPYNPQRALQYRDAGEAPWIQRDRRNANLVATAANPMTAPLDSAWQAGARYWHLYNDGALYHEPAYGRQRAYVSDPSLLAETPLTSPLLGGAETVKRLQAGGWTDRREVPFQPLRFAAPDTVTAIGTGATGAWWSIDDTAHFGPAQRRTLADQSSQPSSTPYDPTTAPAIAVRLTPATHAPRPRPAAPRPPAAAIDDPVTSIGTGSIGAWWSVDDWAHFGPAQRRSPGVPDDTVIVGTGAMVAWWGGDDTAAYIGQRRPFDVGILGPAPVPFDPTLGGWPADWLTYSRAATHGDRRLVPQQRPYISDPGFYPLPPNTADPLLLAGAVGGDLWRRYLLPAFADRREVPQQPARRTLYFDAGPGVPPLTLAWGAGGALWHLYNRPSRLRPFWPQLLLPLPPSGCDCQTHRPFAGTTARPGPGTTARPFIGTTGRPCSC